MSNPRARQTFASLSDGAPSALRTVSRGEVFHAQGDRDFPIGLVRDGLFKLVVEDRRAQPLVVGFRARGWFLGAAAALSRRPLPASSVAVTPSTVYEWKCHAFLLALEQDAGMARHLMRAHATELCSLVHEVQQHGQLSAMSRLVRCLRSLARSGERQEGFLRVVSLLPQRDLAEVVGCSREHLCRMLAGMEKAGTLRRRDGAIWIKAGDVSGRTP